MTDLSDEAFAGQIGGGLDLDDTLDDFIAGLDQGLDLVKGKVDAVEAQLDQADLKAAEKLAIARTKVDALKDETLRAKKIQQAAKIRKRSNAAALSGVSREANQVLEQHGASIGIG